MNHFQRAFSIFVLLFLLGTSLGTSNWFEDGIYIRERDRYALNLDEFISMDHSSLNFHSNNDQIQLPGVVKNPQLIDTEGVYLNKQSIQVNNHIYYIQEDLRTVLMHLIDPKGNVSLVPTPLQDYITKDESLRCSDITFKDDCVIMICYRINEAESGNRNYLFLQFNDLSQTVTYTKEFQSKSYQEPKIKLFKEVDHLQNMMVVLKFILFEGKKDLPLTDSQFTVCEISINPRLGQDQMNLFIYSIKNILFGGNDTPSRIENILIKSSLNELYFVVSKEKNQVVKQWVASCQFHLDKQKILQIVKCSYVFKDYIKMFFLKKSTGIHQDKNSNLQFCQNNYKDCRVGKINPQWKIMQIFLTEEIGIVIFQVKNQRLFIINNFVSNSLNWYTTYDLNAKSFFLYQYYQNEKLFTRLINFLPKGFTVENLTVQRMLEINSESLQSSNDIEVYLDSQQLMALHIVPYDF